MDIKKIKALAALMESSGLTVLELHENETGLRLERAAETAAAPKAALPAPSPAPEVKSEIVNFNNVREIKSPMVGVFYCAPSPDAEPFVSRGDKIKTGDTLCIIEAMKLMNEINAETEGEIVDICVGNGEVVEFGQTLFKVY